MLVDDPGVVFDDICQVFVGSSIDEKYYIIYPGCEGWRWQILVEVVVVEHVVLVFGLQGCGECGKELGHDKGEE